MFFYFNKIFNTFGINPKNCINSVKGIRKYLINLYKFRKESRINGDQFGKLTIYPCLSDRYEQSGNASGHYFHQDLLIASLVYKYAPMRHIDIGSRIDGFVSHVATFRTIEVIDIRPLVSKVSSIRYIQADLMGAIEESLINSCDSLSCLHAIEHFGLGRYGDPINYYGHLHGLENMAKMLKNKGKFYLSFPFGPQRIEYDAHRVFSLKYAIKMTSVWFDLDTFSYVDDVGDLHRAVHLDVENIENNFGCIYGCAIMELTKRSHYL